MIFPCKGLPFRTRFRIAICLVLAFIVLSVPAIAGARFTGKIIQLNPGKKLISILLSDGNKMNFVLEPESSVLKQGASVNLSVFNPGEVVILNAIGALNEDPVRADMLSDQMSAPAPQFYSALAPYSGVTGGTATSAGPTPSMGPQPTLINPMIQGGVPGSTMIPPQPNMAGATLMPPGMPEGMGGSGMSQQGTMSGGGAMPAPAGSPFTGDVLSQGTQTSSMSSIMSGDDTETQGGYQPLNQGAPVGSTMQFAGQIMNIMPDKNIIAVKHLAKQEIFYVVIIKSTNLSKMGSLIKFQDLRVGQILDIGGIGKGQNMIEARFVMVK